MKFYLNKYYYKIRIIITLSVITAALFLFMSRISYFFIKELYLEQLSEKIAIASKMLANQFDKNYFSLLELGMPTKSAKIYFDEIIDKNFTNDFHAKVSIFDDKLNVLISTESPVIKESSEPELLLYRNEISKAKVNNCVTSIPFKGNDNNWYLYGFYKIDKSYYLAIKAHATRFEKVENFNLLFWIIGLGGILIIAIISWFLASAVLKPVNKLVDFSKRIGESDFTASAPENIKGEMAILSRAMDNMRENIAENHREREKILAQIAHEIRNPLGGIELLAELTMEDLKNNNLTTEYQQKILGEIYRLKSLITSYLNYSKPAPASASNVKLNEVIEEIAEIFSNKVTDRNIELNTEINFNEIIFDKDHLKHILINLVSNSIEAINKNGTISIYADKVNGWQNLSVSDSGSGIPEENIDNIFEPFFTTKEDGTGLGLAICKKYAFENQAEIILKNNLGAGSTFTLKKRVRI